MRHQNKHTTVMKNKKTTTPAAAVTKVEAVKPGILIESGVPLPPKRDGLSQYSTALKAMKPGDSFAISYSKQAAVRLQAKKLGVKITLRRTTAEGEARVWRLV